MRESLTEAQLANGLREYVSKNALLAEFARQVEENRPAFEVRFNHLKRMVATGNYLFLRQWIAKKFDYNALSKNLRAYHYQPNENIQWDISIHLLYLIEKQEIPFWQGLTFYSYAMACIEYIGDEFVEMSAPVRLIENKQWTEKGKAWVKKAIKGYHVTLQRKDITKEALLALLLTLPAAEQIAFEVVFKSQQAGYDNFHVRSSGRVGLMRGVSSSMFYNFVSIDDRSRSFELIDCMQPSFSVLLILLSLLNTEPMQMLPRLGRIGLPTLFALHRKDQHFVALSSPYIKSNYQVVHYYNAGSWAAMQHDIGHTFWASVLALRYRLWLQTVIIPEFQACVEQLKIVSADNGKSPLFKIFNLLNIYIERLQDYDLLPVAYFARTLPGEALFRYLMRSIAGEGSTGEGLYTGTSVNELKWNEIGELGGDVIMILLLKIMSNMSPDDAFAAEKVAIKKWLMETVQKYQRKPRALDYILALGNGLAFNPAVQVTLTDPDALINNFRFASGKTRSQARQYSAWNFLKNHPDLDTLILEMNLKWFPPYIMLKPEECALVIACVKTYQKDTEEAHRQLYQPVMQALKNKMQHRFFAEIAPRSQEALSPATNRL